MRLRSLIGAAVIAGSLATGVGVAGAAEPPPESTRPTTEERCERYAEHADEIAGRVAALTERLAKLQAALAEHPDKADRINAAIAATQRKLDRLATLQAWAAEHCSTTGDATAEV